MLTAEEARESFSYDPKTGILRWKVDIKKSKVRAGQIAGWIARASGNKWYRTVKYKQKNYYAHRIIMLIMTGEWPECQVDHEDGDGLNNRLSNLRCVTVAKNRQNSCMRPDNSSGFTGVSFLKKTGKWRAEMQYNGKYIYLGVFDEFEDAVEARKVANEKYGFHKNHGVRREE